MNDEACIKCIEQLVALQAINGLTEIIFTFVKQLVITSIRNSTVLFKMYVKNSLPF